MLNDERAALEEIVSPIVSEHGLELFQLTIKHHRNTAHIELFIDFPNGGVRMEDCACLNRKVAAALDVSGIYGDDYTLSVCSPGLDWPLKTVRDFQRVIGSKVEVCYSNGESSQLFHIEGNLNAVGNNAVVLLGKKGEEVEILLEYIQKAYVKI
jgi:ribosome maturation factor RimP